MKGVILGCLYLTMLCEVNKNHSFRALIEPRWDHFLQASQKCGAFFIDVNYCKTVIKLCFVILESLQMIIKISKLLY